MNFNGTSGHFYFNQRSHPSDQELTFRCENPSAMAIVMQFLTRQATAEKIKVDIRPSKLHRFIKKPHMHFLN